MRPYRILGVFFRGEKLVTTMWLDCICACGLQSFTFWKLSFTAHNSAAMKPRVPCSGSFYSSCKALFICAIHFKRLKCKNLTFSSLQVIIGSENKISPWNGL